MDAKWENANKIGFTMVGLQLLWHVTGQNDHASVAWSLLCTVISSDAVEKVRPWLSSKSPPPLFYRPLALTIGGPLTIDSAWEQPPMLMLASRCASSPASSHSHHEMNG